MLHVNLSKERDPEVLKFNTELKHRNAGIGSFPFFRDDAVSFVRRPPKGFGGATPPQAQRSPPLPGTGPFSIAPWLRMYTLTPPK